MEKMLQSVWVRSRVLWGVGEEVLERKLSNFQRNENYFFLFSLIIMNIYIYNITINDVSIVIYIF